MTQWLPRLVARLPASVHTKLLAAFLVIAGLLLVTVLDALGGAVVFRAASKRTWQHAAEARIIHHL